MEYQIKVKPKLIGIANAHAPCGRQLDCLMEFCKYLVFAVLMGMVAPSFSQSRIVKGMIVSKEKQRFVGGLVVAEPSQNWTAITTIPVFKLRCQKSDTSMLIKLYNRHYRVQLSKSNRFHEVKIDSLPALSMDSSCFQMVINVIPLPTVVNAASYFVSSNGIYWSQVRFNHKDSLETDFFKTGAQFNKRIRNKAEKIVETFAAKEYNNPTCDDGQEIEIKIWVHNHLYEYVFQLYYLESINDLIKSVNAIMDPNKRIDYSFTKNYYKG